MTVPKKLTKQHFEFIVQIIELFKPDVRLGYELGVKWGYNVEKIADELREASPNFDWDKFIDACWSYQKKEDLQLTDIDNNLLHGEVMT